MDRKEQEACNWISKREKHPCKGDEKAGGPDGAPCKEPASWEQEAAQPNWDHFSTLKEREWCVGGKGL